ncbi:MAG: hypothetical protein HY547_04135 [Elusimicrobia bacterium]|nr:hypothetical protein [Elusimicrobiota bacterium]
MHLFHRFLKSPALPVFLILGSFYLLILRHANPGASLYHGDALRMALGILPVAEHIKIPEEYGQYGASGSPYGLMIWILAFITKNVALSLFLPALAALIAYLIISAAIGRRLEGTAMAFFSVILTLCCPSIVLESRLSLYHQIFTLTIGGAMILVSLQSDWTRWKKASLLTALLGIGLLSGAFNCALFIPSMIIVLMLRPGKGKIQHGGKLAALLALAAIFMPKIKQLVQIFSKNIPTSAETIWSYLAIKTFKAISSIDFIAGSERLAKLLYDLFWRADSFFYKEAWLFDFFDQPLVPAAIGLLFIAGLWRSMERRDQTDIALWAFLIPPALMLGFIVDSYDAHCAVAFMPAILTMAARETHLWWNRFPKLPRIAAKTIISSSIAAMLIYAYLYCVPTFDQRNPLEFVESVAAYVNNIKNPQRMVIFLPFLPHDWTEAFHFITRFKYAGRVFPQPVDHQGLIDTGFQFAKLHPDNRSLIFIEDRSSDKRLANGIFSYYPPDSIFFKYIAGINAYERKRENFPSMTNFYMPALLEPQKPFIWNFNNPLKGRYQLWCRFKPVDPQSLSIDAWLKTTKLSTGAKTACGAGSESNCWKFFGSHKINAGNQSLVLKNSDAEGDINLHQCLFINENEPMTWPKKIVSQTKTGSFATDKKGFYEFTINSSTDCINIVRVDNELYPNFVKTVFMRFLPAGKHRIDAESSCRTDETFNIAINPLEVIRKLTPKDIIASHGVEISSESTKVFFSPTEVVKHQNRDVARSLDGKLADSSCYATYRFSIPESGPYDLWVLIEYGKTAGEFYLSINEGQKFKIKPLNITWGAESYARWVKIASVNFDKNDFIISIGTPLYGKDLTLRDILIVKTPDRGWSKEKSDLPTN